MFGPYLVLSCLVSSCLSSCGRSVANRTINTGLCGHIRGRVVSNAMVYKDRSRQTGTKFPLFTLTGLVLAGLCNTSAAPSPIVVPPSQYLYVYAEEPNTYHSMY